MSRAGSSILFALLLGCAHAPEAPRATTADTQSPEQTELVRPRTDCFWVWTAADGPPTSARVCDDGGETRVTDTEPGIHLVVGEEDVSLVLGEVHAVGTRCEDGDTLREGPTLDLVGHYLDRVSGSGSARLLEAPHVIGEEFEDRIEVLATLGPYVAVRRFTHTYDTCGAEAYESTEESWLNLETGEALPRFDPSEGERDRAIQALVRPALAADRVRAFLEEESDRPLTDEAVVSLMTDGAGSVGLGELVPHLDSGRWTAHRVTRYAIDDNADAIETTFEVGELPPPLAEHAEIPAAVQPFLRAPGGWSRAR